MRLFSVVTFLLVIDLIRGSDFTDYTGIDPLYYCWTLQRGGCKFRGQSTDCNPITSSFENKEACQILIGSFSTAKRFAQQMVVNFYNIFRKFFLLLFCLSVW